MAKGVGRPAPPPGEQLGRLKHDVASNSQMRPGGGFDLYAIRWRTSASKGSGLARCDSNAPASKSGSRSCGIDRYPVGETNRNRGRKDYRCGYGS